MEPPGQLPGQLWPPRSLPATHWAGTHPGASRPATTPGSAPPWAPPAQQQSLPSLDSSNSKQFPVHIRGDKMISELYRQAVLRLPAGRGRVQSGDPGAMPASREPFQQPAPRPPPCPPALAAAARHPQLAPKSSPWVWEEQHPSLICRRAGGCGRAGGPRALAQTRSRSPCPASAP